MSISETPKIKKKRGQKMLAIAIFLTITIIIMVTYIGFVVVEGE
jgi:hypothetical protein